MRDIRSYIASKYVTAPVERKKIRFYRQEEDQREPTALFFFSFFLLFFFFLRIKCPFHEKYFSARDTQTRRGGEIGREQKGG